jgi:ankyrin repeat protein
VVQLLLEHKADVDTRNSSKRTALHRVTEEGHEAVVRLLLERKTDVDVMDDDGRRCTRLPGEGTRQWCGYC